MNGMSRGRIALSAGLLLSGFAVSGCVSSPTYGTDKTATEQLGTDLYSMLSLRPTPNPVTEYKPRPELVRPAKGHATELPAPQDSVATADNPSWPESPEQRRARIRDRATENRDRPGFEPEVVNDISGSDTSVGRLSPSEMQDMETGPRVTARSAAQQAERQRRQIEANQGRADQRKYLSEPPLTYRQPAQTASTDELGEDESAKERRLKAAQGKKSGLSKLIPWL